MEIIWCILSYIWWGFLDTKTICTVWIFILPREFCSDSILLYWDSSGWQVHFYHSLKIEKVNHLVKHITFSSYFQSDIELISFTVQSSFHRSPLLCLSLLGTQSFTMCMQKICLVGCLYCTEDPFLHSYILVHSDRMLRNTEKKRLLIYARLNSAVSFSKKYISNTE